MSLPPPSALPPPAKIVSVSCHPEHRFSKPVQERIRLLAGIGVEGDAHAGATVKHRSRVARDPSQPNLRQVHFLALELFDELAQAGFAIAPGDLGENVTTRGVDLLNLPKGARLHLGAEAVVEITGLRNPCPQIEAFRTGLLAQVLGHAEGGALVRKAGIMGIVLHGGDVHVGDPLRVELPALPHRLLERV
jgi:MOSC domain-containing protein YiiM